MKLLTHKLLGIGTDPDKNSGVKALKWWNTCLAMSQNDSRCDLSLCRKMSNVDKYLSDKDTNSSTFIKERPIPLRCQFFIARLQPQINWLYEIVSHILCIVLNLLRKWSWFCATFVLTGGTHKIAAHQIHLYVLKLWHEICFKTIPCIVNKMALYCILG